MEAEDSSYVPNCGSILLCDNAAQYLDKITESIYGFYFCRRRECLLVCPSTMWPNNGGDQHACPACGNQYRPWEDKPGYVKANKVMCLQVKHSIEAKIMDPMSMSSTAGNLARPHPRIRF